MKRIKAELRQLNRARDQDANVFLSAAPLSDKNIFNWRAYLKGPKDTPYEGGLFELDIQFSTSYPFKPPKATFKTKIFHPNIAKNGEICVDILQAEWSPAITTSSLLLSISSLLAKPNPMDPVSLQPASLLRTNPLRYEQVAKDWTNQYAVQ